MSCLVETFLRLYLVYCQGSDHSLVILSVMAATAFLFHETIFFLLIFCNLCFLQIYLGINWSFWTCSVWICLLIKHKRKSVIDFFDPIHQSILKYSIRKRSIFFKFHLAEECKSIWDLYTFTVRSFIHWKIITKERLLYWLGCLTFIHTTVMHVIHGQCIQWCSN